MRRDVASDDKIEGALRATLVSAFHEDPLYRWLYPNPVTRPEALRDTFDLTLSLAGERCRVDAILDGQAVAVWTAPGVELLDDPAPFVDLLRRHAPERMEEALAGMAACQEHQPPHAWMLHVVAVTPQRQGKGIAKSLLRGVLDRCDANGLPAYLESSNERNLTFYRRCGFEALAEVPVGADGPIMRPMVRPPSG